MAGIGRKNITGYPYGTSKAVLIHPTKTLASEFVMFRIRANCVAPGLFVTAMTEVCLSHQFVLTEK
jgi:NAD(P)-dependent dehydrogenase (short-subunit alcohol dehydrogenase family)